MKNLMASVLFMSLAISLNAQKVFTKSGNISFYSDAIGEKIEAHNTTASAVIDLSTGQVQWAVLIKGFEFEKALMQEHFNENYMESSIYPKSTFRGKFIECHGMDSWEEGDYTCKLEGVLEIHGISNEISTITNFTVVDGKLQSSDEIIVKLEDYGIKIPSIVKDNIAKEIKIVIKASYENL